MTNKKLLFIWNYHYFPFEKGKSRFSDLLEAFVKEGYQVEVVTSSFYHMGKTQRSIEDPKYQSFGYKVHFIPEPGYKKNVSFARVRSMNRFNTGVKRYLQKHDSVDAVYVPVPSIKLAAIAEKWCRITKAKCVIDVEDLWPESFQMIIKPKFLCKALTWPLMLQANKAYRKADAVVTVSQTYLNRVKQVREGKFPCAVAPIGADLDFVDRIQQNNHLVKPENEFWICYTGTLGTSYDLETVIDAVDLAHRQTLHTFVFKIMGQGPDEERLLQYAKLKEGRFDFMGLLPYEKMCEILQVSDLTVNPIIKESVASLINKVADYAACGIPVINTQTCQEYVSLLDCTYSGCTIQSQDPSSLAELFVRFSQDPLLVQTMKHNARTSLRPFFSRAESQKKILLLISELLK